MKQKNVYQVIGGHFCLRDCWSRSQGCRYIFPKDKIPRDTCSTDTLPKVKCQNPKGLTRVHKLDALETWILVNYGHYALLGIKVIMPG